MKRMIGVMILVVLVSLAGCTQNTFEDYQEALFKTDNIERGKSNTRMDIEMIFNTEGLDGETVKELKTFENVIYEGTTSFDYTGDDVKVSSMNLLSLGGLGVNFDYHQEGNQTALYIPMVGKYLDLNADDLDDMLKQQSVSEMYSQVNLSEETLSNLDELWRNTFEADEVVQGEKSTMETPEGDVRVVKFTVTPSKEKIKEFVRDASTIIIEDESVQSLFENLEAQEIVTVDEIEKHMTSWMDMWTVSSFSVIDYIDVDGYIVDSTVTFEILINQEGAGGLKILKVNSSTKHYDIENPQDLIFPVLTNENSITFDGLQQGLPSTYENLINHIERE